VGARIAHRAGGDQKVVGAMALAGLPETAWDTLTRAMVLTPRNWAERASLRYGVLMKRTLLTLAMTSLFAAGCGHAGSAAKAANAPLTPAHAARDAKPAARHVTAAEPEATAKSAAPIAATAAPGDARAPGDFVVYRFSGSFRKDPITLTQRVVARQGQVLTVDVTAASGEQKRELRVTLDVAPGKGEVLSVARLAGGVASPASPEAYDDLLAETTLAADQNEGLLGAEDVVLDVGGAPLPCHQESYRVRVGKRAATLRTLSSDGFAWGDVGGEITADSGKVLYRAEVLEAGHAALLSTSTRADADTSR
jgi:hypothetical protein